MTEPVEASADRTEDRARAARIWSELTVPQREFLWCARYWFGRDGAVGCGAKNGAQLRMASKMEKLGLLEDKGLCVNMDDYNAPEWVTFAPTTLGLEVLKIGDAVEVARSTAIAEAARGLVE